MDQLKTLLANLSVWQKATIAIVIAGMAFGLWSMTHASRERDFKPLYSGLSSEDAGSVMTKLKESGIEYRVADNGILLVPSAKVAELRIQMAALGLPRTGRIGYELFDKTNLGQTEFSEQVNFRRALEGELERSVGALSEVDSARVHLVFPKDSVFLESRQPAKASILVKLKPGARLSPGNVTAIQHLTASAVEGLTPEMVAVLDMNGSLLSHRPRVSGVDSGDPTDASLEFRERIERVLLTRVNSTLEPILGPDRFRAGVSVECDFTSAEQSEENFDPSRSVMTTSQKTEDVSAGSSQAGVPGTASALPRPTGKASGAGSGLSRRSENVAFQTSRVVKHTKVPQGAIKRISVSVLLDQRMRWEGVGAKAKRVLEPLPAERLKAIKDVVAAATGIVADRGDQIVVESMPFDATLTSEPPALPVTGPVAADKFPPWWPVPLRNTATLIGAGVAILLVLLVGAVVLLRRKKPVAVEATKQLGEPAPSASRKEGTKEGSSEESPAGLGERLTRELLVKKQSLLAEAEQLQGISVPQTKVEVLANHLSEQAKQSPEGVAQLIRNWLVEGQK